MTLVRYGWLLLLLPPAWLLASAAGAHQEPGQAPAQARPYVVQTTPELVREGRGVFRRLCATCHSAQTTRSKVGPGLKGLFQRKLTPVMGHPVNDASIRDHIHQGGKKMPAFPEIKGRQMDALIAYLKSL